MHMTLDKLKDACKKNDPDLLERLLEEVRSSGMKAQAEVQNAELMLQVLRARQGERQTKE